MPTDALSGNSNLTSGYRSKSNDYGASIASIFDKRTEDLPNIIYAFRNGRTESVGNEDPTYFGFYLDIHSTESESKGVLNPFTGLRGSPLFYFPEKDGSLNFETGLMATKNDGKNFKTLASDPNEASAIQFLKSKLPQLMTDVFMKALGCDINQTFGNENQNQPIYIKLSSIDLFNILFLKHGKN